MGWKRKHPQATVTHKAFLNLLRYRTFQPLFALGIKWKWCGIVPFPFLKRYLLGIKNSYYMSFCYNKGSSDLEFKNF